MKQTAKNEPKPMLCPLSNGNNTEFPFPLSIHGCVIFFDGLFEYARRTRDDCERGIESATYSVLKHSTVLRETQKLKVWIETNVPEYLSHMLYDLKEFAKQINVETDKFVSLSYKQDYKKRPSKTKAKTTSSRKSSAANKRGRSSPKTICKGKVK